MPAIFLPFGRSEMYLPAFRGGGKLQLFQTALQKKVYNCGSLCYTILGVRRVGRPGQNFESVCGWTGS